MSAIPEETVSDARFMGRAVQMAQRDRARAGGAGIACVIVLEGRIIGEGCNEVATFTDPTAHAEIVAIRQATRRLRRSELRGAVLYSTLQPCGMCTMASIWSKIGRIVYGAGREQVHRMYFEDRHLDTMDFIRDAFRDDLSLEGGVLATECARLYHKPGENVPVTEQGNI
jgi:tRNA(adenine34) deaminase